jgi:ribosome-binding protein aMBF1 (putative translation factor)
MHYTNIKFWDSQRKLKMQMESNICEDCGKEAQHVHHIDKKKDNHSLSNLKALCCKCHKGYHPVDHGKQIKQLLSEWAIKPMPLGIQLKMARLVTGLNQTQVAELTGIQNHVISTAERAWSNPRRKTMTKLLDVYGYELCIVKKVSP